MQDEALAAMWPTTFKGGLVPQEKAGGMLGGKSKNKSPQALALLFSKASTNIETRLRFGVLLWVTSAVRCH